MKSIALICLFCIVAILLCSFDGKNKGIKDEAARIAILTTGKWQLVDNYAQYHIKGKIEKHSKWHQLQDCLKDNIMMYHPKGKVYVDQGKLKCIEAFPRIDSQFTWRLDNAEDMLWVESDVYTQPLYIEYISDSLLEVNEWHFFGDSAFIKVYKHILPPKK